MKTLTNYIFFLNPALSPAQIKPRIGTAIQDHLSEKLSNTLKDLISSKPDLCRAIAESFKEKNNQVTEVVTDGGRFTVDLAYLESETNGPGRVIVMFSQAEKTGFADAVQAEKEDFFAELTHEIRTSLNIILGNIRLFNSSTRSELNVLISNTTLASEQMLHLTNSYLSSVKSKEKEAATAETTKLSQFIQAEAQLFRPLAIVKNLAFESQVDPALDESVELLHIPVAQVINNLLSNAIIHTEKGTVSLLAMALEKSLDEIRVLIKVTDTGVGIAKKDQEHVFSRFVQLGPDQKKGSGLGLPIVKKIVNDLGGKISVSSIPGIGSEFNFEFSVKRVFQDEKPEVRNLTSDMENILNGSGKIIVIDDNPINLYIVKRNLSQLGVTADFAENGLDAIKMMSIYNYSMALIDMSMPQIDGLMLAMLIRQFHPGVKIAIFTAGNLDGKIEQLLDLNIFSILAKPYTLEDLREVLKRELDEANITDSVDTRTDLRLQR